MLPFDYEEALKGKICKTRGGDFVIIAADVTKNQYCKFQKDYPLFGVKFNNVASPYVLSWRYNGTSGAKRDLDIIGILEDDELERIDNIKLMYKAMEEKLPINWDDSKIDGKIKVKEMIGWGRFELSHKGWKKKVFAHDLKGLHIIEK